MKKKSQVVFFLLLYILLFPSCWKEKLDTCWQGKVRMNIYAEKFQRKGSETEDVFSERIRSLHYFLYREGVLIEEGTITDFKEYASGVYVFERNSLPFGKYSLLLYANTGDGQVLTGNTEDPASLVIVYPGYEKNDDYFAAQYEFTLDCDCGYAGEILLQRMHGVIQYHLQNIPDNITEIEITMNHLGAMCGAKSTVCNLPIALSYRTPFDSFSENGECVFTLGVFPPVAGNKTCLDLTLYADHDSSFAVYKSLITDQAEIIRNQFLRVEVKFPENGILEDTHFGIIINPKWNGSHTGDVEIK